MKHLNKHIYRTILVLSFLLVNGFILFGLSSVLAYLNSGADRSTMLHTPPKSADVYLPKVNWASLENQGRPMEAPTLAQLQHDYLNAWYVRNVAYQTNDPYGVEDYYTDSSRINIFETIAFNKQNGIHVESSTLNHHPELEFYSADGQLAVFTDRKVVEFQNIYQHNTLVYSTHDTSSYQVMMLLEDGFWRIRHMVKQPVLDAPVSREKAESKIKIQGKKMYLNEEPFTIKGINYYPQASPWNTFGDAFDASVIQRDFQIIRKAGLNAIRIFIQYDDFGKAEVNPEKLEKLERLLDLAQQNQLWVMPTLFDFYGDYSVLNWTLTHRHAEQIVTRFKNHPAIVAWDIKNEPDLDFESRGKTTVLAWLKEMITVVKRFDPNHAVTIGWSAPEAALELQDAVDVVSFHYYRPLEQFENDLNHLQQNSLDKPIVLQEFGQSSYKGLWNPFGTNEKDQAQYHKKMQALLQQHELAFMSWTLYDFDNIPAAVVGHLPWRKSRQQKFGFLDRLGNPKPSFDFICY